MMENIDQLMAALEENFHPRKFSVWAENAEEAQFFLNRWDKQLQRFKAETTVKAYKINDQQERNFAAYYNQQIGRNLAESHKAPSSTHPGVYHHYQKQYAEGIHKEASNRLKRFNLLSEKISPLQLSLQMVHALVDQLAEAGIIKYCEWLAQGHLGLYEYHFRGKVYTATAPPMKKVKEKTSSPNKRDQNQSA
ncbi:hypothetical protein [Persicobacter diffluens]